LSEQRLPLPVGSRHPVRRAGRLFRGEDGQGGGFLSLLGMAAAAAGALLTLLPAPVAAGLDGEGYHVGDATLEPRGEGVYAGQAGAVVLIADERGTRAGASTHLNGEHVVGSCVMAPDGRGERCAFTVGGRTLGADDQLRAGAWDRRYGDGRRARIELAGGRAVPVPFPLGR
jgi:hypothetical protein